MALRTIFNPFTGNFDFVGIPGSPGSFTTIAVPLGTSPVADSDTDTLTFTSSTGEIDITGNSTTDTIDFTIDKTLDYTWTGQHLFNLPPGSPYDGGTNDVADGNECWGYGSDTSGATNCTVLGNSALATGLTDAVIIGTGANADHVETIVIGSGAVSNQAGSIVIGLQAADSPTSDTANARNVIIGYLAKVDATSTATSTAIAVGDGATVKGMGAIAIGGRVSGSPAQALTSFSFALGANAVVTGAASIAIGNLSNTSGAASLALGNISVAHDGAAGLNGATSANNQMVLNYNSFVFGVVSTAGAVSTKTISNTQRTGDNKNGVDVNAIYGRGTGPTGTPGSYIHFGYTNSGVVGNSTAHIQIERFRVAPTEFILNGAHLDLDFRVEAATSSTSSIPDETHLIHADAGFGGVSIGRQYMQTTINGTTFTPVFVVAADTGAVNGYTQELKCASATVAAGAILGMRRSKGSFGSPTTVASGDRLGETKFLGYDGTDYELAADIQVEVDNTVANNQVPGRIIWRTASSAGTMTERMRMDSAGLLTIAGTLKVGTQQTYSASNVTTDRTYDANATTLDELADVVGSLIADLRTIGLVL